MSKDGVKRYSVYEILSLLVYLILTAYIFCGFLTPDPFAFHRFGSKYLLILWGIRIVFACFSIGILLFYYGIRNNRISFGNAMLVILSLLICFSLVIPLGNLLYERRAKIKEQRQLYHPFLQIVPPDFEKPEISDSKVLQIFFLGGSTTEFKDKNGRGWPIRVEERLNAYLGSIEVRAINQGRQWYTSLHSLINYETNLRQYKPDIVIVMHGINDLLQNADFSYFSHGEFRGDYGHFYGPVNRIIEGKSLFRKIWDEIDFWYPKSREVVDQHYFPGLLSFDRNINTLIDIAEKDGAKVILMTQPYLNKKEMTTEELDVLTMLNSEAVGPEKHWNHETALRGMEAFNNKTMEIAKTRGIPLIDLEKAVPKTLDFFYDDVHYQEKAFDLIADYVTEELIKQKVLNE